MKIYKNNKEQVSLSKDPNSKYNIPRVKTKVHILNMHNKISILEGGL